MTQSSLGTADPRVRWLDDPTHRAWLMADANRQLGFFRASLNPAGGFHTPGYDGAPLPRTVQELHTTTRLVHAYVLGQLAGVSGCCDMIDQGMRYLWQRHRDDRYGGYLWALDGDAIHDDRKLAYGHVFVLLAGASAKLVGHPDADRLIDDVSTVLDERFWEDGPGLLADEWNRDWTPFSSYRGMNANMHGVEALLGAYEATGEPVYLNRAGRILDFFLVRYAPAHKWRLAEHYHADWTPDSAYASNPMFRPAGTTPGHSFELARLLLQYWDLQGRTDSAAVGTARALTQTALADAWDQARGGGLFYTLNFDGTPAIRDRYWWPVTEAIGALASLLKVAVEQNDGDEVWYRRLWTFAAAHFVDHSRGGWFPEIDAENKPQFTQFAGKPDIYHALQASLFPLTPRLSRMAGDLPDITQTAL